MAVLTEWLYGSRGGQRESRRADVRNPVHGMRLSICACIKGGSNALLKSPRCPADLIDWPEGTRPKSGNVTKSALLRLKARTAVLRRTVHCDHQVAELREELTKRHLKPVGNKTQLVQSLVEAIHQPTNVEIDSCLPADILGGSSRQWVAEADLRMSGCRCLSAESKFLSEDVWVDGGMPEEIDGDDPKGLLKWLYQNMTGLQIVFLGTSSEIPTIDRHLPSIALRTTSDTWIFDVGEDTQRQCMKHPLIKPGKISRIFLSSLDSDVSLGLPGLLCMIAYSRTENAAISDTPVHIYGPQGTTAFLSPFLELSDTRLEMPVIVHEFTEAPSSRSLSPVVSRAKLWKMEMSPDGLHPEGYYDARLDARRPIKRKLAPAGKRSRRLNTIDDRAGFRPLPLPQRGHPSKYPLPLKDVQWTLKISGEFLVIVQSTNDRVSSLGYRIVEADRAGKLDTQRAYAHGVVQGGAFGILKNGGSVRNKRGEMITSEMVVSPDIPGRSIVILETSSTSTDWTSLIQNADYVITPTDPGIHPSHVMAVVEASGVQHLIFGRSQPTNEKSTELFVRSLQRGDGISVTRAFDLYTYVVPKP